MDFVLLFYDETALQKYILNESCWNPRKGRLRCTENINRASNAKSQRRNEVKKMTFTTQLTGLPGFVAVQWTQLWFASNMEIYQKELHCSPDIHKQLNSQYLKYSLETWID